MPDYGSTPRDTEVQIVRNNTEKTDAIDEDINMNGAVAIIIMEVVDPPSSTPPDRDGPEFAGAATTDGDLDTFVQENTSGAGTEDHGVFDFNSIAVRDLFVKMDCENTSNGSGSMTIETSDDDISYTVRQTISAPDPPPATFQGVAFSGSFRYVRIQINSNVAIGGVIGRLYQVGVGAATQLTLEIKDDADASAYKDLYNFARLDGEVNGSPVRRTTFISGDELAQGEGNSLATLVKTRLTLPSKSAQMKITDPSTSLRTHSITLLKVYRN